MDLFICLYGDGRLPVRPNPENPRKAIQGETLDASEKEWYQKNRDMVDLHDSYTAADDALLAEWT